jgi:hypothetical protein
LRSVPVVISAREQEKIHGSKHSHSTTRKTLKNAAQPHPDAILLWLMAEHTKAQACVDAADILLEAKSHSIPEAKFDRLCWTVSDIEDVILAQPAHTPEGLRIKARIAARYTQSPEDWGLRTYDVFGLFVESVLCLTENSRAASAVRRHSAAGRS